jgi:type IV secretion system protein VirB9
MTRIAALVLLAALHAAAVAAEAPAPLFDAFDGSAGRVRFVTYSDGLVVKVTGFTDQPFVVDLGADDDVREVAGGGLVSSKDLRDGAVGGWEVTRSGGRLFVRPLPSARASTVLVGTRLGRMLVLDLLPAPGNGRGFDQRVSRVVVQQPAPVSPPLAAVPDVLPAPAAAQPADEEAPPARLRNENYTMEAVSLAGADIRPHEVFDDGRMTYFRFPGHVPVPAIYKSVPGTTEEWLVNSHRDGDYIVLHGVGKLWTLRLEGSLVGVFNEAFDPYGIGTPGGSTVPGLQRVRRP